MIHTRTKKILVATALIFNISFCWATQQIPDFLVVGKDTFRLYTFPLQILDIKKAPFNYSGWGFPHTGCYRGYQATYKIIDDKLFLVQVIKVDSTKEKLDIAKYLKDNNYEPTIINGLVFVDWYSGKFRHCERWLSSYPYCIYAPKEKVLFPILVIKSGYIIMNKLYEP